MIKDLIGIQIGGVMTGLTMKSLEGLGAIGSASQSLVGAGFIGSVGGKVKSWLK